MVAFQTVMPLSYVKNNFGRIQTALNDVRSVVTETQTNRSYDSCIAQGIQEACSQYKRHTQTTSQVQVSINKH